MSESEERQQSSNFPANGYEAAEEEEEGQSVKGEEEDRNPSLALPKQIQSPPKQQPAKQQKRGESGVGKRRRRKTMSVGGAAAPGRQMTLFDLDKQLDRQRRLMERMADDVKHLRKQVNHVQRDLAKFEKRMEKMKTTTTSSAKRAKRRS